MAIKKKAEELVSANQRREAARILMEEGDRLRDLGDSAAQTFYRQAIATAPDDPENHFAYAEYLRQYRGPGLPLLPEAATEYFRALRKLDSMKASGAQGGGVGPESQTNENLRRRIEWSLTDLYQRDGLPILYGSPTLIRPHTSADPPLAFFSTQFEFGDQEIPIRDLTSGALFTADTLGRPLTKAELRSLVRTKRTSDWLNRVRFRIGDWPWVDFWWNGIQAARSNVNSWVPGDFFDYRQETIGISVERTFDLYPWLDLDLRAGYARSKNRTVIPGWPDSVETCNTPFFDIKASRVFPGLGGPNKLGLNIGYEYSDIDPEDVPGYKRAGSIGHITFLYSLYPARTRDRFVPRATDIEVGVVRYTQKYNAVEVFQHDWFAGVTVREVLWRWLDFSLRYTATDESKEHSVPERDHSQGCVSFIPLMRLLDNENAADPSSRNSPVRFVNLLVPCDYTFSRSGPSDFESAACGLRCDVKIAHPRLRRTTVLLGAEILRRDYFRLDRSETMLNFYVKMGF